MNHDDAIFIIISILLVLLYLLFPKQFIRNSELSLGKLISILIIVVFSYVNVIYGIAICLIVIWYYQSDYILNVLRDEHFQIQHDPSPDLTQNKIAHNTENNQNPTTNNPNPTTEGFQTGTLIEEATPVKHAYSQENIPIQGEKETIFRNSVCTPNLETVYKNQVIRHPEIISQLYPNISFAEDIACNPCDPSCPFTVKTSLEKTERIGRPTKGQNFFDDAWEWAETFFVNKSEPHQGVDKNVASYF